MPGAGAIHSISGACRLDVHQQVQRTIGTAIGDMDNKGLLPTAQGGVVGHGPVKVRHPQQAGHHSSRLPQRQFEQDLDGQTELDRGIREHRRATGAAVMRREPGHLLVQPDQQRAPLAQRRRVAGPVRRAIAGGCWLAHAVCLTAWIHDVNPPRSELCNSAHCGAP